MRNCGAHSLVISSAARNLVWTGEISRCARNDKYLLEAPQKLKEPLFFKGRFLRLASSSDTPSTVRIYDAYGLATIAYHKAQHLFTFRFTGRTA